MSRGAAQSQVMITCIPRRAFWLARLQGPDPPAGRTNTEVAAELFISVHTVEKALTRIYAKLGIRSRTELALKLAVKQ